MHPSITHIDNPGPLVLAPRMKTVLYALTGGGILCFIVGMLVDATRAWNDYLVSYFFFLCLSLSGLFFTALNHAVNATWVVVTRRISSGLAAFLPVALVLFFGVIYSASRVYPWAAGPMEGDPGKYHFWLSLPFFSARQTVFFLLWFFFGWKIIGFSIRQDVTGDVRLSRKAINWSLAFMPVFAITFSLLSYDLVMSLEPKWYSTMFGVYCFAGLFQSGLAAITLIFLWMKREGGPLEKIATPSHVKDLGTLVFAFTIFMTYIGFSQYMLIWYANMPDETFYFLKRQQGGWEFLFLALPVFKFFIPFFGLLSQGLKKREGWLKLVCISILFGQFLDIYWMMLPALHPTFAPLGWMEIGVFLGFTGLFGLSVTKFYTRFNVLPIQDPHLLESANWRFWE
jgi:hypothetical protein